jgi:hypothetical protein
MKNLLLLSVLLLGLDAFGAAKGTVTLAWDPSPGTNLIANYRAWWGAASATYTNHVNAGTATTVTITNLIGGVTYYFAATAVDTAGMESDYSGEVSALIPRAPTNVLSVALVVQTNRTAGLAPWTNWVTVPLLTVTNPPAPLYYRAAMSITETNTAFQVLRLNSSTLVFTNK